MTSENKGIYADLMMLLVLMAVESNGFQFKLWH